MMRRIAAHPTGIAQGSQMMFTDFTDGGPMWAGSGPREMRQPISFAQSFVSPPAVIVGISMWDVDSSSNLRADVSAQAVTAEGFDLVFRTWGDSRIARLRCDWTAIGPLPDDEMWQLS